MKAEIAAKVKQGVARACADGVALLIKK